MRARNCRSSRRQDCLSTRCGHCLVILARGISVRSIGPGAIRKRLRSAHWHRSPPAPRAPAELPPAGRPYDRVGCRSSIRPYQPDASRCGCRRAGLAGLSDHLPSTAIHCLVSSQRRRRAAPEPNRRRKGVVRVNRRLTPDEATEMASRKEASWSQPARILPAIEITVTTNPP